MYYCNLVYSHYFCFKISKNGLRFTQALFSCLMLTIYVIQHVIPCFPCSVRTEYCNPDCNLFMDIIGTVIISCFIVEHGDCLSSRFYGYIRSSCQQKLPGTLTATAILIIFLLFLFFR